jgi:hypothetical protein
MKRPMRLVVVASWAILAGPGAGWAVSLPVATTAGDLCAPAANPCTVTEKYAVNDGTNFDIGGRDFVMTKSGGFVVSNGGSVTISDTDSVSLEKGSVISSTASVINSTGGTITIDSVGSCTLAGNIIANGGKDGTGGTVNVSCSDISLSQVQATAKSGPGGTVSLTATTGAVTTQAGSAISVKGTPSLDNANGGTVRVSCPSACTLGGAIYARGNFGGSISVTGGALSVTAPLDVRGGTWGFGGNITLKAGGATTIGGKLMAGGDSGKIDVESAGTLSVTAPLDVHGGTWGEGGFITLKAGGATTIGGKLMAKGGEAGYIVVESSDTLSVTAPLDVHSGDLGIAGFITLKAGGATTIGGKLAAKGGTGGGIYVEGTGTLSVTAPLDVHGGKLGDGGNITLKAGGAATIGGKLTAKAGTGGNIDVEACGDLTISAAGALNANCSGGEGGKNYLSAAGGNLTINGPVTAACSTGVGTNTFVYTTKTAWLPSLVNPTASETSGAAACP